ncbi:hypothetical protein [Yersinia kristensenii]|uniref:hypothetical protein n=1 Tax=Yersinia kristensenii TaxID=28152 RepID=UPI0011AB1B36|nr:hypothetical protein [Yersinia kristensenii]
MPATQEDRLYGLTTSVALKPAVAISSDYHITLFGEQTITSSTFTGTRTVTTTTGMRVLVMGQNNPIDNGIWVASPATWRRAPDFDGARDVVNGTMVFSIYGDCWQIEAVDPVSIGYNPINFRSTYPFSGEANLFQRSLRVPEISVSILPKIFDRKNKILAFDDAGNPITLIPESGSATDVLIELAKPTGYLLIPSVQIQQWKNEGDVRGWGAGEAGFNAAMTERSESGGGALFVNEDILFTSLPIQHLPKVTVHWRARAIVQTGLTATYAYVMNGGADTPVYDNTDHFTLANKTNCYGLRLEAQDYKVGINAIGVLVTHCYGWTFEGGAIIGFNNGGLYETLNYEGKASKFTMVVANTRLDNSVGFESNSTDSWFSEISPVGYSIGGKFNKSGNSLDKFHPWGNTVDNRVGVMGKMNVGIIITENAGFSTYSNIILDTPVRKNINNVSSRSNGGVGVIIDAWNASLDGILIIPSRADVVAKSTLPMITTAQKTTIKDLSVSDPNYTTDIWVSFEGNSGIALNHIIGYGYAQMMRTGGVISENSGAVLTSAGGVTLSSQTLSSGIWYNNLTYSITTNVAATSAATSDVIVSISPTYGVASGHGGSVKGGMFAFLYATANSSKQLYDVSIEVVSPNTAKFLLTFIDGATRYARWTDVSSGGSRQISLSGIINIK